MKHAKSIYLGGEILSAEDCDFEDYKRLGLICPYCSEAVFLRSGSYRDQTLRNGKKSLQIINPSFAHYPGSFEGFDCENRSLTKEGRERIEQARIEAKNQRLDLFNRRLWDLIRSDRNIREKKVTAEVKKLMSQSEMEFIAISTRRDWRKYRPSVESLFDELEGASFELLVKQVSPSFKDEEEEKVFNSYFGNDKFSKRLHRTIVSEVCDFLETHTSGHAFCWLTKAAQAHLIRGGLSFEIRDTYRICMVIGSIVFGTHWIKVLNQI